MAFSIEKNSEFGRFAVATRDLKPGEVLFEEFPFAVGPKASTTCCCLECYCPVDATSSGSRCDSCSWPLCEDCRRLSECSAHKRECEVFKSAKCKFFNISDPTGVCVQLDCVTPLRVLLEKESNPDRWSSEVEAMEDHREKRFGSPTWKADEQNVVGYLLGPCKLKQRGIDGELIQRVIGILEVNVFEGRTVNGHSMRCMFPRISVLSHSCTPNTTHSIHPSRGNKWVTNCPNWLSKLNGNFQISIAGDGADRERFAAVCNVHLHAVGHARPSTTSQGRKILPMLVRTLPRPNRTRNEFQHFEMSKLPLGRFDFFWSIR